jgi:hypothetical protein
MGCDSLLVLLLINLHPLLMLDLGCCSLGLSARCLPCCLCCLECYCSSHLDPLQSAHACMIE